MSGGLIENASAAVLCGGKSSRMGFDKAFLELPGGTPLLRQNAEKLAGIFGQVSYMAENSDKLNDKAKYGPFLVTADHYMEAGPMGAICTALEALDGPWVFAMACDMPAPDMALVRELAALRGQNQVALCRHGAHIEPLFAFYHQSCQPALRRFLAEGQRSLWRAIATLKAAFLEVPPRRAEAAFLNLNTQADLEAWLAGQPPA